MRLGLAALAVWTISCGQAPAPERRAAPSPEPVAAPPAVVQAPDPRPVIVAFGDSLTAGPGVAPDQNYPALLQKKLDAAGRRYRVVNLGMSGDTTSGGLARVADVLAQQPRIVIVELGANDGLRGLPVATSRANLDQILAALTQGGVRVVLAGMTLPPNYGVEYIRGFESMFVDLARKYRTARIPFFLQGVAANPTLMLPDGLHPNAAGYWIVVDHVWRALEPLLE